MNAKITCHLYIVEHKSYNLNGHEVSKPIYLVISAVHTYIQKVSYISQLHENVLMKTGFEGRYCFLHLLRAT